MRAGIKLPFPHQLPLREFTGAEISIPPASLLKFARCLAIAK